MVDLPSRLRAARAYAGLSQPELAKKLELGEVTYKLSERGKRHVPRRELLAIAEACEVPMWFLEGGWNSYPGSVDNVGRRALEDLDRPGEDDQADQARGR
jgi:transcriptional regulator with XRE-family HTH domain